MCIYFAAILLNEYSQLNDHSKEIDDLTQQVLDENGISGSVDEWISKANIHDHVKNTSRFSSEDASVVPGLLMFFAILNAFACFYSLYIIGLQAKISASTYFRSVWAYFDIFYVVMNSLVTISFLSSNFISLNKLRQIEAVLCFTIVTKLVYFT